MRIFRISTLNSFGFIGFLLYAYKWNLVNQKFDSLSIFNQMAILLYVNLYFIFPQNDFFDEIKILRWLASIKLLCMLLRNIYIIKWF
jgi:hypothetical protein